MSSNITQSRSGTVDVSTHVCGSTGKSHVPGLYTLQFPLCHILTKVCFDLENRTVVARAVGPGGEDAGAGGKLHKGVVRGVYGNGMFCV